jgi:hypothetical protein
MKRPRAIVLGALAGVLLLGLWVYYVGMPAFVAQQMAAAAAKSAPRSVAGTEEYKGAEFCGTCHPRQLAEWRGSLHSRATTEAMYAPRYAELSWAMPLAQCDGCHAPTPRRAEGIACEGCHGPGRTERVARDICLGCHQIRTMNAAMGPLSTGREFAASAARAAGLDCASCHMPARDRAAFHGFSGSRASPEVYKGVVTIQSIERKGARLVVRVRNGVTGHFLPTGAPENVMFLTVRGSDARGRVVYAHEYRFEKNMFRFRDMPMFTIADTRLRDGEAREVEFAVPETAKVECAIVIRPLLWSGKQVEQVIDSSVWAAR